MNIPNPPPIAATEWLSLFTALIILGLSLIFGAVFIFASYQHHDRLNQWTQTQRHHFNATEKKYRQLQEALNIVNNLYLKNFNQLITEGFFNTEPFNLKEQRLKMFGEIQSLLSQLPIITAEYTLSKKKLYIVPNFLGIEDDFKIYETQLTLILELLHEADLLKLIEKINAKQFVGLVNLQNCDIQRLPNTVDVKEVSKPYFKAYS